MKAIILAGGSGERFWPLSTSKNPKQFLKLFGDRTLLEQTFNRLSQRFNSKDILIITSREHVQMTMEVLPEIPPENVIGEPVRRNTAAACMVGALLSEEDEMNLVVPADHRIPETEGFWSSYDKALQGLREFGGLYTFGIDPTRPDTGYGYIETGKICSEDVYEVKRFREKPDEATARKFLERGGFFWNSGMFLWRSSDLISEMKKCSPDIHGPMEDLDPRNGTRMQSIYPTIPKRSVDHAVMEISDRIMMVKGSFDWSDVGNWNSIQELEGYTLSGPERILVDSSRIFIRSESSRPTAVVGLEGIIVIDTKDGLLICSEDQVQKVREISRVLS
jgi:mannose-1-phosphate guanylyltransferase